MPQTQQHKLTKVFFCGRPRNYRITDRFPSLAEFENYMVPSPIEEADVLFVSHSPGSYRQLFSTPDTGQIRVFIGGEAVSPDLNLFDYAISFDHTIFGERTFRPHTLLTFENDLKYGDLNFGRGLSASEFLERPGFCDFIYGNRRGHPARAELFRALSKKFRGVKSYGRFLNDSKISTLKLGGRGRPSDWRTQKIEIQKNHFFSIAAENAAFRGYTSEKILTSLMAGSIPIYWGNPSVSAEFNEKRFVQFDGNDFDSLYSRIQLLSSSKKAMLEVVREPAMTITQLSDLAENRENFQSWFSRFFCEDLETLQRRPRGWYPDWYSRLMSSAYSRSSFSGARISSYLEAKISKPRS